MQEDLNYVDNFLPCKLLYQNGTETPMKSFRGCQQRFKGTKLIIELRLENDLPAG